MENSGKKVRRMLDISKWQKTFVAPAAQAARYPVFQEAKRRSMA